MPFTYDYPRPMVTVDILLLRIYKGDLQLLLIQRGHPPFEGKWALPGGYVDIEEPIRSAAERELQEETGIKNLPLLEAGVVGTPGRDPRGRTITIVHVGAIPLNSDVTEKAGDDARLARWFPMTALPATAFDHDKIIPETLAQFRLNFIFRFWSLLFMPEPRFSLNQLKSVWEIILNRKISSTTLISLYSGLDGLQFEPSKEGFIFTQNKTEVLTRGYDDLLKFWLRNLAVLKDETASV